ncbi:MAG: hypothetical protein MK193_07415 [Lentisphaeria bacterium]|nr:hypothetical protein [Lentisphaeria bacterium]
MNFFKFFTLSAFVFTSFAFGEIVVNKEENYRVEVKRDGDGKVINAKVVVLVTDDDGNQGYESYSYDYDPAVDNIDIASLGRNPRQVPAGAIQVYKSVGTNVDGSITVESSYGQSGSTYVGLPVTTMLESFYNETSSMADVCYGGRLVTGVTRSRTVDGEKITKDGWKSISVIPPDSSSIR